MSSQNPLGYLGINPNTQPTFLSAQRAPTSNDLWNPGTRWQDNSVSPAVIYETLGNGTWQTGGNAQATETTLGIAKLSTAAQATTGTDDTTIMTPAKVALVALSGVADATEVTKGVAQLATTAEAEALTNDTDIVTPLKLSQALASGNGAGSFTSLAASGAVTFSSTGAISMVSNTASLFDVTGAGVDLTLSSDAGRVVVNGEEAAADAVRVVSAAGGLDVDVALQMNLASSQNAVDAIRIVASAGGIDIDAVGAATEDINVTNTGGSIVLVATENVADAIVLNASAGGIDITAAGAATEDIDIVNTAGSIILNAGEAVSDAINIDSSGGIDVDAVGQVNIASSQNAADAIVVSSSAGGIDILATGSAGEDIDIVATGSSVNVESTENAALAVYLHANGGTSETIRLRADQGTGVASIDVLSDVGGITLTAGLGTADAINLSCSNAAGGIDADSGTSGTNLDSTGAISLDAAAASNFSVSGAGIDLTLASSAGRVVVNGEEAAADALRLLSAAGGLDCDVALQMSLVGSQAAADAIRVQASDAAGGIDVDCGTGGLAMDSTGAVSLQGAASSDFSVSGAGIDLTLDSAAGQLILTGGEAAVNAVRVQADDAAGGIDVDAGTGGIAVDTTGALSLDSAAASNLTVTGAFDLTVQTTAGSLILSASEDAADAVQLLSTAGGIDVLATGAAGQDIDVVNTGGSVNITATEAAANAIVITASNAAGGIDLTTGGGSIDLSSAGAVSMVPATDSIASPTATVTANSRVGRVLFTGFTTASGADQDFTVTNSAVTTSSCIFVTVSNVQNANDCDMLLEGVRVSAGSFVVHTTNAGPAALDGNVIISWWVTS